MRTYLLAENNWKNLKTERFELAVMAWGATEAHNVRRQRNVYQLIKKLRDSFLS